MNEIKVNLGIDREALAWQMVSLIHIVIACVATVIVLKKRKELNFGILPALLIAWVIAYIGPASVIWGLREPQAKKAG
jgi:hypothetical protein